MDEAIYMFDPVCVSSMYICHKQAEQTEVLQTGEDHAQIWGLESGR